MASKQKRGGEMSNHDVDLKSTYKGLKKRAKLKPVASAEAIDDSEDIVSVKERKDRQSQKKWQEGLFACSITRWHT